MIKEGWGHFKKLINTITVEVGKKRVKRKATIYNLQS